MKPISANPRARTAELYRMGFYADYEAMSTACSEQNFANDTEHINFHRPELYAMLSQLVNETVKTSLDLRQMRGDYGLVLPGGRAVTTLRNVSRLMHEALCHDSQSIIEELAEVVDEVNPLLLHLQAIDKTSLGSVESILSGGTNTMLSRFDNLYWSLERRGIALDNDTPNRQWMALLDQTKLSIPELVSLDHYSAHHGELYEIATDGTVRFCKDAIQLVNDTKQIPERDTIGCPISFEPTLLKELWQWYVELKNQDACERNLIPQQA